MAREIQVTAENGGYKVKADLAEQLFPETYTLEQVWAWLQKVFPEQEVVVVWWLKGVVKARNTANVIDLKGEVTRSPDGDAFEAADLEGNVKVYLDMRNNLMELLLRLKMATAFAGFADAVTIALNTTTEEIKEREPA